MFYPTQELENLHYHNIVLLEDYVPMRINHLCQKGVIGDVDGCKIVKVPSSRLPAGCAFLLMHPSAATAPKQLEEYKTHADPVGVSGWIVEGRVIYDCFVLNEKADAIFYHGGISALKALNVVVSQFEDEDGTAKVKVMVNPGAEKGATLKYKLGTAPEAVTANTSVDDWSAMTKNVATDDAGDNTGATVAEVKDGKVVEQGKHEELLRKKGYYHDLYSKQFAEESQAKILK